MIVLEKVRAICQQLPQYSEVIPSFTPRARAKDFYDIFLIMKTHTFDPGNKENIELLKQIFSAKKVPTAYLQEIKNNKNLHEDDWTSVIDTVYSKDELEDFDYYFDFVVSNFSSLTTP